jgi:integrase
VALEKANQYLSLGHYSPLTIRHYLAELRFFFVYYPDAYPLDFTEAMITQYLLYLAKTLECSRVKCRMSAQSISFFMRHVAKRPYVIPTVIYPRPENKLPPVMLPEEIMEVIDGVSNLKHRTILMLLYSSGMRVSEIANCRIANEDGQNDLLMASIPPQWKIFAKLSFSPLKGKRPDRDAEIKKRGKNSFTVLQSENVIY